MKTKELRVARFVNLLVVDVVGDFDTPRYVQRSSICCEGLAHAESHAYINGISGFSVTCQRGTSVGISLEVFADADYASKATEIL